MATKPIIAIPFLSNKQTFNNTIRRKPHRPHIEMLNFILQINNFGLTAICLSDNKNNTVMKNKHKINPRENSNAVSSSNADMPAEITETQQMRREGKTIDEIATIFNLPPSTMRNRLAAAGAMLKKVD